MASFAVYCLIGVINLVSAVLFKEGIRKLSKICLMPALLAFYLIATPHILPWIIVALVLAWAGDILLIKKEKPAYFRLGLAAFLLSHVFYIVAFLTMAQKLHILALIVSLVVAIPLTLVILKALDASAPMKIPVTAYAVAIILMSICALQLMLAQPGLAGAIVFAASVVYIFSDALMAYLLFHKSPKYFNAITMVPYIVAQGGIILGLVMGHWN